MKHEINQPIRRVLYGETNDPDRQQYFPGFHLMDTLIAIELGNGSWLSIRWNEEEGHVVEEGYFPEDEILEDAVLTEATQTLHWYPLLGKELKSLATHHIDSVQLGKEAIIKLELEFTDQTVWVVMAEEPHPDELPKLGKLNYDPLGWMFVIFEESLLGHFGHWMLTFK